MPDENKPDPQANPPPPPDQTDPNPAQPPKKPKVTLDIDEVDTSEVLERKISA